MVNAYGSLRPGLQRDLSRALKVAAVQCMVTFAKILQNVS